LHVALVFTFVPQMPDNWREVIDRATRKPSHVERPGRPLPRASSRTDVSAPECGAAPKDVSSVPRRRGSRGEEKALPTVGSFRYLRAAMIHVSTIVWVSFQIHMSDSACLTQDRLSQSPQRRPRSSPPQNIPLAPCRSRFNLPTTYR
jgi:hypothetical protein